MWNFFSLFNELIFTDKIKNIPNVTIIIPANRFKLLANWLRFSVNILLIRTPRVENTIENPRTKNIVLTIIFILFIWKLDFCSFLISVKVVPEIYEMYPGISGNTHGDKKLIRPAKNATDNVVFI